MERNREEIEHRELLAGIIAATIANYSTRKLDEPALPKDFMPSQRAAARPVRMTKKRRQQVANDIRALFAARKACRDQHAG